MKKIIPGILLALGLGILLFSMWYFLIPDRTKHHPVLLCDPGSPVEQCQQAQAMYSLDGMDGMWVIDKLWLPDGKLQTFNGTDCWIEISGGTCEASGPNSRRADFDMFIIPLR